MRLKSNNEMRLRLLQNSLKGSFKLLLSSSESRRRKSVMWCRRGPRRCEIR
jgi:hypothetical protein